MMGALILVGIGAVSASGCADDDPEDLTACPDAGIDAAAPDDPEAEVSSAPCDAYLKAMAACGLATGTHIGSCDNTDPKTICVATCAVNATCKQLRNDLCRGQFNSYAGCLTECQDDWVNPDFDCGDGTRVRGTWRCDGNVDCANGADEDCPPGMFICATGTPIPEGWHCDHHPDCLGGEDEFDCPYRPVFTCDDGATIVLENECDGTPDCAGGEDESDCAILTCQ
jgi:hypothetical protein